MNWTEKYELCKRAGIKYIHSVEAYLTESLNNKVRDNYHVVLMAKNDHGKQEINELISRSSNPDHFYFTNRITFDEFLDLSNDVLTTSACLAGPLRKLPHDHPRYMDLLNRFDFLEIQHHNVPEQIEYNKYLYELSLKYQKTLLAGTDTHSSTPYKAKCREVLMASKHMTYGDEDKYDLTFKTFDELCEAYRVQDAIPEWQWRGAIDVTNWLPELCDEITVDTSIKYPILYGTREKDAEKFSALVEEKFQDKLAKGIIPPEQKQAFREAIDEEMRVFNKLDMAGFMLSESELLSWCGGQGIPIGYARGSVAGSRVAYIADIIDVNPETWNTVFSRFCNEDRVEVGDIDTDCTETDRPKILKHIVDAFGTNKTARVALFGTMKDKMVIDTVGRYLADQWKKENPNLPDDYDPWNLRRIAQIKHEFDEQPEETKQKYPELFYYFDGLNGIKVSQSIHPAGIVISPIELAPEYGVFDKDGESCLLLDMDCVHDVGLVKYDMLVSKTVQVIKDTFKYIGRPYPKSHEVDWEDQAVWEDMAKSGDGIFQFESKFAQKYLRKFRPKNLFELSLVTASIRPSGESYRDDIMARRPHQNPSPQIDELLSDSLGYLVYQEQTIAFLQQLCGLSGSEADTIRRAIAKKKIEEVEAAMPKIVDGYCEKSPKPREEAENEVKEFLQVISDSASYQFGKNHSIAYCMLSYLCGYLRYHHPIEFITAYLNNSANDEDARIGAAIAESKKIEITMPKWGISRGNYFFDANRRIIAKGLGSIKYMGNRECESLYALSQKKQYSFFVDLLIDLTNQTNLNSRQLSNLIKLDFFTDFGNQRELINLANCVRPDKHARAHRLRVEQSARKTHIELLETPKAIYATA